MGRESRVRKPRTCPSCEDVWRMDTVDFREHVALCRRATEVGLELPNQEGYLILPGYTSVPVVKEG